MNCKIGGWKDGFDPFYGAPAMLIVLGKKDWVNRVYDGSLVMGNLMLAAHELGIGSCWIHRAKEEFEMERGKITEYSQFIYSCVCRGCLIRKAIQTAARYGIITNLLFFCRRGGTARRIKPGLSGSQTDSCGTLK